MRIKRFVKRICLKSNINRSDTQNEEKRIYSLIRSDTHWPIGIEEITILVLAHNTGNHFKKRTKIPSENKCSEKLLRTNKTILSEYN